jgi:hypothetical protein
MIKKFNKEFDVWINYFTFLFKEGQSKVAHELLQRAFASLPKSNRIYSLLFKTFFKKLAS